MNTLTDLEAWQIFCPTSFRECSPKKLPNDISRAALAQALAWNPEQGGIGLVGRESGQGKTLILYAVARRFFFARQNLRVLSVTDFAWRVADLGEQEVARWLANLQAVDFLFLDDLGRCPLIGLPADAIFCLIEHRTTHGKPLFFTSSFSGEELAARFGDHGPYIVRRLRECCHTILL